LHGLSAAGQAWAARSTHGHGPAPAERRPNQGLRGPPLLPSMPGALRRTRLQVLPDAPHRLLEQGRRRLPPPRPVLPLRADFSRGPLVVPREAPCCLQCDTDSPVPRPSANDEPRPPGHGLLRVAPQASGCAKQLYGWMIWLGQVFGLRYSEWVAAEWPMEGPR